LARGDGGRVDGGGELEGVAGLVEAYQGGDAVDEHVGWAEVGVVPVVVRGHPHGCRVGLLVHVAGQGGVFLFGCGDRGGQVEHSV